MKLRGEVWWVNFDPSIGQEIKKKRPAIIVSNNISNKFLKRFQVVPISSRTTKIYPSETKVTINGKENKAMIDQIMTVRELRFLGKITTISFIEMKKIEDKIRLQLDL